VDAKKLVLAVVIAIVAAAAAILSTAHSRKVLAEEQNVFPPGVLAVGQPATINGCSVWIEKADVAQAVPSLDTRGSAMRPAGPDWRFVRLTVSVENRSASPVNLKKLFRRLRIIETSTGRAAEAEVVWLRGAQGLPTADLPPGQREGGKMIALYVSGYTLVFPFIVEIGDARWGVDVIDRNAPVKDLL